LREKVIVTEVFTKRVQYGMQNRARELYFKFLNEILETEGMELDILSYPEVAIVARKPRKIRLAGRGKPQLVAYAISNMPVGDVDDMANEIIPCGCYDRIYEGLVIRMVAEEYREAMERVIELAIALFKQPADIHIVAKES